MDTNTTIAHDNVLVQVTHSEAPIVYSRMTREYWFLVEKSIAFPPCLKCRYICILQTGYATNLSNRWHGAQPSLPALLVPVHKVQRRLQPLNVPSDVGHAHLPSEHQSTSQVAGGGQCQIKYTLLKLYCSEYNELCYS